MPSLGAEAEPGTLVEWKVKPGDAVKRGDVVAVVEGDKGAIEVEVFENGVVEELRVAPGERVPAGAVLAVLRGEGDAAPPSAPAVAAPAPTPVAAHVRAAPAARARARELGVDLSLVPGSGPEGAVTREDVEEAARRLLGPAAPVARTAPVAPAAPKAREEDRHAAMRRAIAGAMSRSKREIPHYYLSARIDFSPARAWIDAENRSRPVTRRLLPAALLVKAVARSVADVPEMNGFFVDGAFRPGAGTHVGFAVSLRGGGLVAPAIHDADRRTIDEVMAAIADLITRSRAGTLRSSELADPTITVTSLGDLGVDSVWGVVNPPQVAIVGFGRIAEQPWAEGGRVEARPVVTATLSADHRVGDGHRGGLFLDAIARRLAEPSAL
jgi:pyruvate dehydrogenase E2 component (dihydrolipoamide acetyltransferase)